MQIDSRVKQQQTNMPNTRLINTLLAIANLHVVFNVIAIYAISWIEQNRLFLKFSLFVKNIYFVNFNKVIKVMLFCNCKSLLKSWWKTSLGTGKLDMVNLFLNYKIIILGENRINF